MSEIAAGAATRRYAPAAIVLHWIIAVLILSQIGLGWYMANLPDDSPAQDGFEARVHIPLGLTILVLSVARLVVRLANPPPPINPRLAGWEKALAGFSHVAFNGLILALPLAGWALKSFGPGPISFWGLFNWPHLPVFGALSRAVGMPLYGALETAHGSIMVWTLLALLALHVAGALKHQFDGAPVLWRMLPFLKKPAV